MEWDNMGSKIKKDRKNCWYVSRGFNSAIGDSSYIKIEREEEAMIVYVGD